MADWSWSRSRRSSVSSWAWSQQGFRGFEEGPKKRRRQDPALNWMCGALRKLLKEAALASANRDIDDPPGRSYARDLLLSYHELPVGRLQLMSDPVQQSQKKQANLTEDINGWRNEVNSTLVASVSEGPLEETHIHIDAAVLNMHDMASSLPLDETGSCCKVDGVSAALNVCAQSSELLSAPEVALAAPLVILEHSEDAGFSSLLSAAMCPPCQCDSLPNGLHGVLPRAHVLCSDSRVIDYSRWQTLDAASSEGFDDSSRPESLEVDDYSSDSLGEDEEGNNDEEEKPLQEADPLLHAGFHTGSPTQEEDQEYWEELAYHFGYQDEIEPDESLLQTAEPSWQADGPAVPRLCNLPLSAVVGSPRANDTAGPSPNLDCCSVAWKADDARMDASNDDLPEWRSWLDLPDIQRLSEVSWKHWHLVQDIYEKDKPA